MNKNKSIIYVLIVFIVLLIPIVGYLLLRNEGKPIEITVTTTNEFNPKIIQAVNQIEDKNFLISPYSIEIALSMLRDGADGETKTQIRNLVGNRKINNIKIKERINVANAAFIKDNEKKNVLSEYSEKLKKDYDADIIYDSLKTYKTINNWVNKETYGMIKQLKDDSEKPEFKIAIANAVAIDVDWARQFECDATSSTEFTKQDNSKYNVSMMHQQYMDSAKYFDLYDAKGVILPYKSYDESGKESSDSDNYLEFIGILPNVDIKTYLNNITDKTFADIDNNTKELGDNEKLFVALPTFSYAYDYTQFKDSLIALGVEDAFIPDKSDLTNMLKSNGYVNTAIHKTYIELNESGTKAAAVTLFGVEKNALPSEEEKMIKIEFNKPFAYIIRDHKTKEMLFFGVVYEPNEWTGSTCKK